MDKIGKNSPFLFFVCLAILVLYAYNPFNLYFLADDFLHVPESVKSLWVQQNSLRPVGNISLHLDYLIGSTNALGYHITNLLLHILNTILVFAVSCELFKLSLNKEYKILALLVAVLFFSYPFHSEAVFWVIGRSASLGALFFLAACYCWLKQQQATMYSIGIFVFFEFALLSYESSWVFPVIVLLLIALQWKNIKTTKKQYWLLFACVVLQFIIHLVVRFVATKEFMNLYDAQSFVQLNYPLLVHNFMRLFVRTLVPPFFNYQYLIITFDILICTLLLLVFLLYKKKKLTIFFWAISVAWLISYVPYLSIGIDTHGVEGERYLYLPSMFFCIWLVYVLQQVFQLKKTVLIIGVCCCMGIVFLFQARSYYVKSGKITQQTVQAMQQLTGKEKIFFSNLPQYNKGAVVFRTGLEDAAKWLCNIDEQRIIIVSKNNSDEVPKQHHTSSFTTSYQVINDVKTIDTILVKDATFRKNYIVKAVAPITFNIATNAWFIYSDTALTIIR